MFLLFCFVVEAKDGNCVLHLVSCRLCRLVPAAGSEQLRVRGSTEAGDAVRHRERSGGEERSLGSVPHGGGLSPQSAPAPPEKRSADKLPRRWPQMWPGPHWSLGTLGLDNSDESLFTENHNSWNLICRHEWSSRIYINVKISGDKESEFKHAAFYKNKTKRNDI